MYSVSDEYREKIKSGETSFHHIRGTIRTQSISIPTDITAYLCGEISRYNQCISSSEALGIGSVYQGELIFSAKNIAGALGDCYNAEVKLDFGLELSDGTTEWVPLGIYYVEETERSGQITKFKALDAMNRLDIPVPSEIAFTYTFEQAMRVITKTTGVEFAQTFEEIRALTSAEIWQYYGIGNPPTLRKVLQEMAELFGGFAYINRDGKIEFKRLDNTTPVAEITADRRHSLTLDRLIQVGRVQYTTTGGFTVIHTIQGGITVSFADNGMMPNNNESQDGTFENEGLSWTLAEISKSLKNISYTSGTVEYSGDPALDIGDYVTLSDGDAGGELFLIGTDNWTFHGIQTLTAPGLQSTSTGAGYSGGGSGAPTAVTSSVEYLRCTETTGFSDNGLTVCEIEFRVTDHSATAELSGDIVISTDEKSLITAEYYIDNVAEKFTPKITVDGYATLHLNHVFSIENGEHSIRAVLSGTAFAEQCEVYLIGENITIIPMADTTSDDYIYTVGDTVTLLHYIGSDKRIRIPDIIENMPVTVIELTCFTYSDVTEVIIPDGVTTIN